MEENFDQKRTGCLRIVLFGPESTGKTTMAKSLALHYNTQWVPEFARDYLQQKWDNHKEVCSQEDLKIIAAGQIALENKALQTANDFLFCDTNILVTQAWSETHFDGYCDPLILRAAERFQYDFYFLTDIDVPWLSDDLRDSPNQRSQMFTHFKKLLNTYNCNYATLSGSHEERLKTANKIIKKLQSSQ